MDHSHHGMSSSTTSAAASAASSTSTMSHSMTSHSMEMGIFHWGDAGDGIWLTSWVPNSRGAYIGACFGLFFVSFFSRTLPAFEAYFVAWRQLREKRKEEQIDNKIKSEIESSQHNNSFNNLNAYPSQFKLPIVPSFSWKTDTVRSFLTAVSSFVGYLLMMVVMTGNGGYLLVVVLGVLFGEIAFGRFRALNGFVDDHSH